MELLRAYLEGHGGVLSTHGARSELGLTSGALRGLVGKGVLTPVCRGGYVETARLRQASVQDAHRLRVRAVLATAPDSYAASHQSAAVVLGLPLLARDLERVHVVRRTDGGHGRRLAAFTVHECTGLTFREVDGMWCVGPVAAVLGAVALCGDIGGQGVVDAALRAGHVTREELQAGVEARARHTGAPRMRRAVERADPSAESVGESGLRVILRALGYRVQPQAQVWVGGELVARVDFYLPELGVVVEFDGAVKYEGADGRDALVREKRREDRLRAAGLGVVRVTWALLFEPERIRRMVQAAARTVPQRRRTAS